MLSLGSHIPANAAVRGLLQIVPKAAASRRLQYTACVGLGLR